VTPRPHQRSPRRWHRATLGLALAAIATATSCWLGEDGPEVRPIATPSSRPPPAPPTPEQSLGADQPPVIWIGGTLTAVEDDRVELLEGSGSLVVLQRLGRGTTAFFEVAEGRWVRLDAAAAVAEGQRVCVETLMDGSSLLALRVFLGAGCGPG
jgi:hypothetical protein